MAHFVIMGCGRVGATLAHTLEDAGHSVAIIDQDEQAFRRLRTGFGGRKVTGVGFDRETLQRADIADAYAFAAVSSGDNSNILATRVANRLVNRLGPSAASQPTASFGLARAPSRANANYAASVTCPGVRSGLQSLTTSL